MGSNRGAARVSAIWLIVAGVLFLVAVAFGFIAQGDMTTAEKSRDTAIADKAEAETRWEEAQEVRRNVSVLLGWYDRESADQSTDVEEAKKGLEDLKSTFSDLTDSDADFQSVLPKMVAAYNERGRKIAELEGQIQTLQAEVSSANSAATQVASQKDETISGLRQELADQKSAAESRESELNDRLSTAQDQVSERDQEVRNLRVASANEKRQLEDTVKLKDARILDLTQKTRFVRGDFANDPDGKIIEVSDRLNMGWIDIGSRQRLTTGMRFRVESGNPRERGKLIAYADVVRVEERRAEVVFSGKPDPLAQIAKGDVVVNRLYDPKGTRNAILVGRFSGRYNEKDLRTLLGRIGINVQDKLSHTTNFCIVGAQLFADPETNEPLDEPVDPTDLPDYRDAVAQNVVVVSLADIEAFLRGAGGVGN